MRQQEFASPEEALAHFGKKGMKWGVRNEEEPVGQDSAKPALSERKQRSIEKFQKRSDVMNTRISELKISNEALKGTQNPAKRYAVYVNNQDIKVLEKTQKRAIK